MNQQPYSSRNPPPSHRQLLIILAIFLTIIIAIIWLLNLFINGLIGLIPPEVEQTLGTVIVPIYEQQSQSSPTQSTLNQLINRLENHLDSQNKRDYRVLYVPEETVNALAIPGDVIIIYKGLLAQVESENELMMIMGHELGHFAHRDHLRRLGRSFLVQVLLAYLFGDSNSITSLMTGAVQIISNANYSQSQETQADEFGLILLNKTYGHVAGATNFFTRLSQNKKENRDFLSTHPSSRQRVQRLEKLINKYNYQKRKYSPLPSNLKM